jgi:hypothetical protein
LLASEAVRICHPGIVTIPKMSNSLINYFSLHFIIRNSLVDIPRCHSREGSESIGRVAACPTIIDEFILSAVEGIFDILFPLFSLDF